MRASSKARKEPRPKRPLTLVEAAIPILTLLVLVALAYFLFGDEGALGPNQVALALAAMVTVVIGLRAGFSLEELRDAAVASVGTGVAAIFILFAVGALIGTWALSGTLTSMVYYGMQMLSPNYFYATAAVVCAFIAFVVGSSWTVVGTIGVGLVAIATTMDLNPAIAAGAVISGSYVGDKSSPLSDTVNLAVAVAGSNLYTHVREALWVSVPAFIIALVLFLSLGRPVDFNPDTTAELIRNTFGVSLWHFLPLLIVLTLALLKFPPFTAIMIGALSAAVLAVSIAPERVIDFADAPGLARPWALLKGAWVALAGGYSITTGYAELDELASRGGMESMLNTIWLVIAALAYGGVVEKAGVIERLVAPLLQRIKSNGALVASLVGSTFATNIVTADQYIAVVLPGKMFKSTFAKRGLAPVVQSRVLGDSATVGSALIPWNSCGAYMAGTLGVATLAYAPFTFFNILCPLVSITYGFLGFRMLRRDDPRAQDQTSRTNVELLEAGAGTGAPGK